MKGGGGGVYKAKIDQPALLFSFSFFFLFYIVARCTIQKVFCKLFTICTENETVQPFNKQKGLIAVQL